MPRRLPPYVECWRDRHGKVRIYFRKNRGPRIPLPAAIGSAEFSRPLRSRFEGWLDGEHLECQQEKEAQNHPQPGEDEPKIVADGTQDDVGGIAGATSEIRAAEMPLCLHMSNPRLDRGAPSELAFNAAEDPALLA